MGAEETIILLILKTTKSGVLIRTSTSILMSRLNKQKPMIDGSRPAPLSKPWLIRDIVIKFRTNTLAGNPPEPLMDTLLLPKTAGKERLPGNVSIPIKIPVSLWLKEDDIKSIVNVLSALITNAFCLSKPLSVLIVNRV